MMPEVKTEKKFDVFMVPLQGSNLIEASAGTGKTYSIAILVLRLILENRLSIREILMVTYTKAAVAELEERIRLFVRRAYRISQSELSNKEKNSADPILQLVQRSIQQMGAEEVNNLLRDAILYLDETSVLTIHSFCQLTLNEFAFETNQLFSAELITDTSEILEDEVNKFWRKYVATIDTELLTILIENNLCREGLTSLVKEHLKGKRFHHFEPKKEYSFSEKQQTAFLQTIRDIKLKEGALNQSLLDHIGQEKETLREKCESNRYAKASLLHLIEDGPQFLNKVVEIKNKNSKYVFELFADIIEQYEACEEVQKEAADAIQNCLNQIYNMAIIEIEAGVRKTKLYNNQLSFDDLIVNLNKALTLRDNPALVKALQSKYKAVFIDEFQDTDRLQYEIFNTAFGQNTVLFYIGDPKQSIYAWRKADIFTYFIAKEDVEERYEMNINFRSAENYIRAMNLFFLPEEEFDTFHFQNSENKIKYHEVNSPQPNDKGFLQKENEVVVPITINNEFKNKEDISDAVARQIADLFKKYSIVNNKGSHPVKPSDIGILVRNHKEGVRIKKALAALNIPTVSISNEKVLQSPQATELLYVLEAMMENKRENINKALLTSLTGYKVKDILTLNEERVLELFKNYKNNWERDGVYATLMNFIADFEIQKKLLSHQTENSERIITNLFQLIELLYKNETVKNMPPLELIDWLKRGIENKNAEGDELEQRIENDEEAVKIVTIHSSKGLQYKIVFAPYLDFVDNKKFEICSFRDEESGDYISAKRSQLTPEQEEILILQNEQENRRLLYVTLTRAIYKSFVYRNTYHTYKNSTLSHFIEKLESANPALIEWMDAPQLPEGYAYSNAPGGTIKRPPSTVHFSIREENWRRMSYTMLASKSESSRKPIFREEGDSYDTFIFNHLSRGNITGNMLHFIFENIHFNNNQWWPATIVKAIRRFAPTQEEGYTPGLSALVQNVLNAQIHTTVDNFRLTEINFDNRLHELEFDFPVSLFNPSGLADISHEKTFISTKIWSEIEGMMNGKIDLFFEHKGKYFVLDWKSNYLGGSLEDYSTEAVATAMNENNYHLQYLIYTVAVKKYLESRLPDFNYERDFGGAIYLFIRGMREGIKEGVYYVKPSLATIEKLEGMFREKV